MLILKSTHEAVVRGLKEQIQLSAQAYAEAREDYRAQIADLRKLVFPEVTAAPPGPALEADAVIMGSDKPYMVNDSEHNRAMDGILREQELILSDNYAEDLLQ